MNNTDFISDKYTEFITQLQLVCRHLTTTEKAINEIINSAEEKAHCNKISLGDVIMKDYSVLSPGQAKGRKEDVLGIVFQADGGCIKLIAPECAPAYLALREKPGLSPEGSLPCDCIGEALLDVKGKLNTEILKNTNDFSDELYPAVSYCLNYSRFKSDKGNWYLPSLGELNVISYYRLDLNDTLKSLNFSVLDNSWYLSSTVTKSSGTFGVELYKGVVSTCSIDYVGRVLPCLSIRL